MNVAILGCGVYGLALASRFLDNANVRVTMWSKFDHEVQKLRGQYSNISFTIDLKEATRQADLIVIAVPVSFLEETMVAYQKFYHGQDILIASKGIDEKKQRFAYEIVKEYLEGAPIGVISGGTFAQDMKDKKVMGLTLGTKVTSIRDKVKKYFAGDFLKVQYTDDYIGVSVCGAIKNVMAIGFGMLDGAKYPTSSRFLFLTEAIYEIRFLIGLLGGNQETVMSYAGIDDIMMTCTSSESRNYTLGKLLGEQKSKAEIQQYKDTTTIEGLGTSRAICDLAKEKSISLPIVNMIYKILYEDKNYMELVWLLEKGNLSSD